MTSSSGELSEFVAVQGRVAMSPTVAGNLVIAYSLQHTSPQVMAAMLQSVYASGTGVLPGYQFAGDLRRNFVLVQAPDQMHGNVHALISAVEKDSAEAERNPQPYVDGS